MKNYPNGAAYDDLAPWHEKNYDEEKSTCMDCLGTGLDDEFDDLCFSCSGEGLVYIDRRGDYEEE